LDEAFGKTRENSQSPCNGDQSRTFLKKRKNAFDLKKEPFWPQDQV
jgi:hypothetical protein